MTPDREPPGATGLGTVPVFSPDGKTFIVTAVSHQPGPVMGQLVVASADGRRPAVAIGPAYSYQDRQSYGFSPDGTKVILDLVSGASWMLDVAGGNSVQVKQFLSDPSWQRRAP